MVAPSFGLSIIEVCKFIADGKPRSSVWRARDKFAGLCEINAICFDGGCVKLQIFQRNSRYLFTERTSGVSV